MLTEQTVLLAGPKGRRSGLLYAAGATVVLVVLVGAIMVLGRSLSLPTTPHLNATLDLVIGGVLLALALVLRLSRPRSRKSPRHSPVEMSPPAAFGFGVFSMATNITTLALVVPAAREIAASNLVDGEGVVAACLVVALACLPAWGPIALESAAPATAERLLEGLDRMVRRHGRLLVVLLVGAVGAFLVARGVVRLIGL